MIISTKTMTAISAAREARICFMEATATNPKVIYISVDFMSLFPDEAPLGLLLGCLHVQIDEELAGFACYFRK